jgi:hypothetical protein
MMIVGTMRLMVTTSKNTRTDLTPTKATEYSYTVSRAMLVPTVVKYTHTSTVKG